MKQDKVNILVLPDIKRTKNNKRVALKLRITYKGKRKYYSTGYDASKAEWAIINSAEAKGRLRRIKNAIAEIEMNAQKCCDTISPFCYKQFEYNFFDQQIIFENLKSAYANYIEQLKKNEQYSSSVSYQTALNNFEKFRPNLKLGDITIEFLECFERWMLNRGKSITTVGIHIRTLRAVLNVAKDNGAITNRPILSGEENIPSPMERIPRKH